MGSKVQFRARYCRAMSMTFVLLVVGFICRVDAAEGQKGSAEAVAVAYVIESDTLSDLQTRLAIDTQRGRSGAHMPAVASSLAQLAESVGARVAALNDVRVCPPLPRPIETFEQGCRFKDGIEVVLSVGTPERTPSGLVVWVDKNFFTEHPDRPEWAVWGHSRQVLLSEAEDGTWDVIGFGPGVQQT